jgi:hypothetical protein
VVEHKPNLEQGPTAQVDGYAERGLGGNIRVRRLDRSGVERASDHAESILSLRTRVAGNR